MNAFRLVFLLVVLLASALLSFSREAPKVFSTSQRQALERTLETAARGALIAENGARVERELVARRLYDDPMIQRLLADADDGALRARSLDGSTIFAGALQRLSRASGVEVSFGVLYGPSGEVYSSPRLQELNLSPIELARLADLPEATQRAAPVHRYFVHGDELWASVAYPMEGGETRRDAQIVLVERWGSRGANALRRASGAHIALFHDGDVLSDTFTDDTLLDPIRSIARRTNAFNAGSMDQLGLLEFRSFPDSNGIRGDEERVGAFAPVAFRSGDTMTGAILMVDAPRPGSSLFDILVQGRAWDDGTADLWFSLAAGLLLFFLGLFLHDYSMQRGSRRLESDVEAVVTTNDPAPLDPGTYTPFFRPIARAFNHYLESTRQQGNALRRLRDDLAATRDELDEAMHLIHERGTTPPTTQEREFEDLRPDMTLFSGPEPANGSPRVSASAPTEAGPAHGRAGRARDLPFGDANKQPDDEKGELDGALDFLEAARAAVVSAPDASATSSPPPGPAPAPQPAHAPELSSRPPEVTREVPSMPPEPAPIRRNDNVLNDLARARRDPEPAPPAPIEPAPLDFDDGIDPFDDLPGLSSLGVEELEAPPSLAPARPSRAPTPQGGDVTAIPGLTSNAPVNRQTRTDDVHLAADALTSDASLPPSDAPDDDVAETEQGTVPRASLDALAREARAQRIPLQTSPADAILEMAEQRMRSLGMSSMGSDADAPSYDPALVRLYDEYMAVRAGTEEGKTELTLDDFARRLERNRAALMRRHRCSNVRFRVELADGKAALKATPIH